MAYGADATRGGKVLREDELAKAGAVELLSDMLQCPDAHGRQVVLALMQVCPCPLHAGVPLSLGPLSACLPACLCLLVCLCAVH